MTHSFPTRRSSELSGLVPAANHPRAQAFGARWTPEHVRGDEGAYFSPPSTSAIARSTSGLSCTPMWLDCTSMQRHATSSSAWQIMPLTSPSLRLQIAVAGTGSGAAASAGSALWRGEAERKRDEE